MSINIALPSYHFSWPFRRELRAGAGTSVPSRFSVNSSKHSRRSRNQSSDSRLPFLFSFLFWVFEGDPHQFPGAGQLLPSWAGLAEEKSCNVDVEDEILPELADNPGTTSGTEVSVLHKIVIASLVNRGF